MNRASPPTCRCLNGVSFLYQQGTSLSLTKMGLSCWKYMYADALEITLRLGCRTCYPVLSCKSGMPPAIENSVAEIGNGNLWRERCPFQPFEAPPTSSSGLYLSCSCSPIMSNIYLVQNLSSHIFVSSAPSMLTKTYYTLYKLIWSWASKFCKRKATFYFAVVKEFR